MKKTSKPSPANNLNTYRYRASLRIRDVVRLLGQSGDTHYGEWARGDCLPSLRNVLKLSFILKCPVEVLFFDLYDEVRSEILARKKRIEQIHAPPE
jgi:transcriptional regulator with XRE-family HTH domain